MEGERRGGAALGRGAQPARGVRAQEAGVQRHRRQVGDHALQGADEILRAAGDHALAAGRIEGEEDGVAAALQVIQGLGVHAFGRRVGDEATHVPGAVEVADAPIQRARSNRAGRVEGQDGQAVGRAAGERRQGRPLQRSFREGPPGGEVGVFDAPGRKVDPAHGGGFDRAAATVKLRAPRTHLEWPLQPKDRPALALPAVFDRLRLPVIASPLFIISNPKLAIAQCTAGVVGSFPALNARPETLLDDWLSEMTETLAAWDRAHPATPSAPFAVNQIVHRSNSRLEHDVQACVKHKVPVVITSLGAREDVNAAIHSYGGIVLHDVINDRFAHKAIEKGADGLILVAAGAGGHAGTLSPFALVQEVRRWFDGPVALSGAIATGGAVLAAQAMGADFGYIGSAFIATEEANAAEAYKQMIVDSDAEGIVYSNLFTGVHGNYLKGSITAAGLDPANLETSDASAMNFGGEGSKAKAWKDVWGAGQGVGAVDAILPAAKLIERLAQEYEAAKARLLPSGVTPIFQPHAA